MDNVLIPVISVMAGDNALMEVTSGVVLQVCSYYCYDVNDFLPILDFAAW